jgi:hypothetical protein
MIEYIRSGGEDLTNEEEILTKIEELDVYLLLCRKVEIQNTKKVQGRETKREKKDESSGTTHESTACRSHDRAHLWNDCPDNKFNKQKKKEYKEEKAKKSEEQNRSSIHTLTNKKKKTPMVKVEADLKYDEDNIYENY